MVSKEFELRERATQILGLNRIYSSKEARESYVRQIKMIHPDIVIGFIDNIPNDDLTKLVIQAYHFLVERKGPTTMLENDDLVSTLIGKITPIKETKEYGIWNSSNFYDSFNNSIWPKSEEKNKYKFGGIC